MQLVKAKLIVFQQDKGSITDGQDIEFMFNPTELSFSRSVKWESDSGNRGSTLLPKVNFGGVEPYKFTLSNLLFDTYEIRESVMTKYIDNIKKGVTARDYQHSRPPVYILTWDKEYFHCVMNSLTYKLTLFLTDGTPVRALVDISLQEVDPNNLPGARQAQPNRNSTNQPNLPGRPT
jgi:hypothetical protein